MTVMGGKDVAKAIRRKHKGKTPNEPVFQPEKLPSGSIIAMDLSIFLVNFVKSDEGSAQVTSSPLQSCTSVQDRLDFFYIKECEPRGWKLLPVVDASFQFKDDVVRANRNKLKSDARDMVDKIRQEQNFDAELVKKLRRAEKRMAAVTCDVVANAVQWARKRPGKTSVIMFVIFKFMCKRIDCNYLS